MAGSHTTCSSWMFKDHGLAARLEALQVLAEQVSDRVLVLDRDRTVLYANRLAWPARPSDLPRDRPAKCYEAFLQRADPCETCPAMDAFDRDELRSVACSPDKNPSACGMVRAFPLLSDQSEVECVLMLLQPNGDRAPQGGGDDPVHTGASGPVIGDIQALGNLVGQSGVMQRLFDMIRLVANSQATVLVQGESGTGKELVARNIHDLSPRKKRPFVVVDCGSLPESLLESELFGHVRGAFTGAHTTRKGLFEEANGGTIFLDEIADTSLHFQSKLLRVIQEGEVKPVGSSRSFSVDVRVISATNKDLLEQVKAGRFREDLYYRLAVLPLFMPPLRDRREDIPLLVRHFVERTCARHGKPARTVTPEAMRRLMDAPWPGNVRELEHCVERAVVTATGPDLAVTDFFGSGHGVAAHTDLRTVSRRAAREAERIRIEEALCQAGGNKVRAARALRISRANLYNKLRAYGIEW